MKHPCVGKTKSCSRYLGHMTKCFPALSLGLYTCIKVIHIYQNQMSGERLQDQLPNMITKKNMDHNRSTARERSIIDYSRALTGSTDT